MKKFVAVSTFVLCVSMASAPLLAKANPSEYNIPVHVSASRIGKACDVVRGDSVCHFTQTLTVWIEGLNYELEAETAFPKGMVALGDYKARFVEEEPRVTKEFSKKYDLMFADGSTREFTVIAQFE